MLKKSFKFLFKILFPLNFIFYQNFISFKFLSFPQNFLRNGNSFRSGNSSWQRRQGLFTSVEIIAKKVDIVSVSVFVIFPIIFEWKNYRYTCFLNWVFCDLNMRKTHGEVRTRLCIFHKLRTYMIKEFTVGYRSMETFKWAVNQTLPLRRGVRLWG